MTGKTGKTGKKGKTGKDVGQVRKKTQIRLIR